MTRRFPGVLANDHVSLCIRAGSMHAIVGENGAGKSTLLNLLYGRLKPDSGRILVEERDVTPFLDSPAAAISYGLGLVSQHYSLIPALSVLENVLLGCEGAAALLPTVDAAARIRELSGKMQLPDIPLRAAAGSLSVATQQKVEILKALYRGARCLLLDEPTATLAPSEASTLFTILRALRNVGATVVFVTHRISEVMEQCDRVTVLRRGKVRLDRPVQQTTAQDLIAEIVGPGRPAGERRATVPPQPTGPDVLRVSGLSAAGPKRVDRLRDVEFTVRSGEILGVAGVDGSGQAELVDAIVGLRRPRRCVILLHGKPVTRLSVASRRRLGLAYVPEDRQRSGLVLDFSVAENLLLGRDVDPELGGGPLINYRKLRAAAARAIATFDVRAAGPSVAARTLSGGNQQKLVLARAILARPTLLVASQPTRGLDPGATRAVHEMLFKLRKEGSGILVCSLDLDELLGISDRILVLFGGAVAGILTRAEASMERIGGLMTGGSGV